ncbi:hypothetical protein [Streptomyces sp. AC550_RSS872]|uniref:hypothetical protein n=1 Tax=Streptomyces sp. AC550_RSS872 TaxID=2823689 RepID=UPI0035AB6B87
MEEPVRLGDIEQAAAGGGRPVWAAQGRHDGSLGPGVRAWRHRTALAVASPVACGISPDSPQADPIVAALTAHCALAHGRPDDTELHRWLLHRLEAASDPRRDQYFQLLALINGRPAPERLAPVIDWSVTALRMRAAR